MLTLFESFGKKHTYDVINVNVTNSGFSHKIQDLCFDNGIWWIGGENEREYTDYFYSYCLDINFRENVVYFNPSEDGSANNTYWKSVGQSVDPRVYREEDYNIIKNLVVFGCDSPSYKPRRTERTLEKRNSLEEATEVAIIVNSSEELKELREAEEALPVVYTWPHDSFSYFPIYFFFNLVNRDVTYVTKSDIIRYLGPNIDMDMSEHFNGVYYQAFKMKHLDQFMRILVDRKITPLVDVPSYKPRKIVRTLESSLLESVGEYLPFRVWCDDREKSLEFEDWLFDNGWRWDYSSPDERLIRDDNDATTTTFCNFDKENKKFDAYGSKMSDGYILYEYPKDLNKIRNTIIKRPDYSPKRTERTLERLNSLDEAGEVWIVVDNKDELNTLKQEMATIGEYGWPTLADVNDTFPFYLFVDLSTRNVMIGNHRDLMNYLGGTLDITRSYIFDGVYETPYTMKNLKQFIRVLTDKKITPIKNEIPSYQPRKIDRTLESFDGFYKYDVIVFETKNKEECDKVQRDLFKQGYSWNYSSRIKDFDPYDYPVYLFAKHDDVITYMSARELRNYENSISKYISHYNERAKNACETVFGYLDSENVNILLKYGKRGPSYEPKRTERTLEAVTNDVSNLYIWADGRSTCLELEDFIHKMGFAYRISMGGTETYLLQKHRGITEVTLYGFNIKDKTFCAYGSHQNEGGERLYYPVDKDEIRRILLPSPSYEPRKITRTLETYTLLKEGYIVEGVEADDEFSIEVNTEAISMMIQNFLFKQGYKWHDGDVVRPMDPGNIITCYKSSKELVWIENQMRFDEFLRTGWRHNPKIYTMNGWNTFSRLVSDRQYHPSYEPKKIERTLESYSNPRDLRSSMYFQKYNTLVFSLKQDDNTDDIVSFLTKLDDMFETGLGQGTIRNISIDAKTIPQYVRVTCDQNGDFDMGFSQLTSFSRNASRLELTYRKMFSFSDIFKCLDMVLRTGEITPSYAPKKIERTLESYNNATDVRNSRYFKDYNTLVFSVKPEDDQNEVRLFLQRTERIFRSGLDNSVINYILEQSNVESIYVRLTIDGGVDWGYSSLDLFPSFAQKEHFTCRRIFSFDEVRNHFDSILDRGDIVPSYAPKKIIRTLETVDYYPYRFKTDEEMKDKYGYDWRDTAFPGVGWNPGMDHLLGKDFPYSEDKLDLDSLNNDESSYRLPIGDIRFTDEHHSSWLICWDMLTRNKPKAPNYEPKRIERTLEKFHEKYKYNSIVVVIKSRDEMEEARKYLGGFGNYDAIYHSMSDRGFEKGGYYIRINENDYRVGQHLTYADLCYLEPTRFDPDSYERPFTINDLRRGVLDNIFNRGVSMITPSYEPRRTERTLEGVEYKKYFNNQLNQETRWKYRFKTKKEFNETCVPYFGGWRCGKYLFIEDMFYLFGKNLEEDYPEGEEYIDMSAGYHVTKLMLVKNDLAKPDYSPRKTNREI